MAATPIDLAALAACVVKAAGSPDADVHGSGIALANAAQRVGARSNRGIAVASAAQLQLAPPELIAAKCFRRFPPLQHPGALPEWFNPQSHVAETADLRLLRLPGGHLLHLAHAPVVLAAGADAVVRDFSGRYAPLVNHVDLDLAPILRGARAVSGPVFVLGDEIAPPNYCHWMLDALPRLQALERLGARRDVSVAVAPLTARFQRETLHRCGFDDARIIELGSLQALRAGELLATSDLPDPPHPAFKASAWALRLLRSRLGAGIVSDAPARRDGRRLYVSRGDGAGRRVVNEAALLLALRPLRVEAVQLAGMTVREQAALFAEAAFIVGPHGAGLTNAVFARPGTGLLEIFPRSYGMASYSVLAMGVRLRYAYLIAQDIVAGSRAQLDDMRVDVAEVTATCGTMLR